MAPTAVPDRSALSLHQFLVADDPIEQFQNERRQQQKNGNQGDPLMIHHLKSPF